MEIPKLTIGNTTVDVPVIQGGMGVRVSLASLATAVANAGGIGTISSMGLGDIEKSLTDYENDSRDALIAEIRKAKSMTDGALAVNIMGVLSNADDLVKTSVAEGIKIIIFGAGLPTKLPALVPEEDVSLVPIIGSGRIAKLIMRTWDKKYQRMPDAFILEGPLAGGHLGFSLEQLEDIEEYSLEKLLPGVLEELKPFEEKYGKKIPVIVAGGVYTGEDIAKMIKLGASGVQMGTRFVATEECGVSQEFKQAYIDAKEEDIVIIKSPVGLPGRAINNKFMKDVEAGKIPMKCPYHCLTSCKMGKAKYCIAQALVNSYFGDVDKGLLFCGQNAYRVNEILPVQGLIDELKEGIQNA